MKTILKFTTVIALLLVTVTAVAKEPKLRVINKANDKALVFEWDTQEEDTYIQIVDAAGNIIYYENVLNTEVYTKKFDLKNLEEGNYLLEAENALKKITYTINVDDKVGVAKRKESAKPVFRKVDGMVYLNLLNLEGKKVEIKVLDSDNRMVFKETLENETLVEKAFNFKNAYAGNYTVIVRDNTSVHYEDIVVN
ncbi:hypothetical protein [Ulvibacterium sp.]|uniref:hypothetical protein n=1 Tax=Ulvibacterium sp. TaxID=2665914 RepID=UPI003BAD649F